MLFMSSLHSDLAPCDGSYRSLIWSHGGSSVFGVCETQRGDRTGVRRHDELTLALTHEVKSTRRGVGCRPASLDLHE